VARPHGTCRHFERWPQLVKAVGELVKIVPGPWPYQRREPSTPFRFRPGFSRLQHLKSPERKVRPRKSLLHQLDRLTARTWS
jgi:hypothetical protein